LCSFESPRPLRAIAIDGELSFNQLQFNSTGEFLIMTLSNSEIRLLNIKYPERNLILKQHDAHTGGIASCKLNFDERCIISAGKDGILFVHALDKFMLIQESSFNALEGVAGIDFMPEA
jgi:WD40 repeat protein